MVLERTAHLVGQRGHNRLVGPWNRFCNFLEQRFKFPDCPNKIPNSWTNCKALWITPEAVQACCVIRFPQWEPQWMYGVRGCFFLMMACAPECLPAMCSSPSYGCPHICHNPCKILSCIHRYLMKANKFMNDQIWSTYSKQNVSCLYALKHLEFHPSLQKTETEWVILYYMWYLWWQNCSTNSGTHSEFEQKCRSPFYMATTS